jgi:hypothetical protein
MKSSFGTFVLRFAATAVLFAPAAAAQTPGVGQSVCRQVWDWGAGKYMQVCDSVYYPPQPTAPAPPPPPEPPVAHTTGSETTVRYDGNAEVRRAQSQATGHQPPPSSSLCPPLYRMTALDGCQK